MGVEHREAAGVKELEAGSFGGKLQLQAGDTLTVTKADSSAVMQLSVRNIAITRSGRLA